MRDKCQWDSNKSTEGPKKIYRGQYAHFNNKQTDVYSICQDGNHQSCKSCE